jgi:RHS repeat-associated protein
VRGWQLRFSLAQASPVDVMAGASADYNIWGGVQWLFGYDANDPRPSCFGGFAEAVDRGTAEPNDELKFATYTRDAATGLDYADQRYYANNFGRFMSPDRYRSKAGGLSPASWNRYAYAIGDPVSFYDPHGRDFCEPGLLGDPERGDGDDCCDDFDDPDCEEGGGGGGSPANLQCSFTGDNIFSPRWSTSPSAGFGFYLPDTFTFTASGGTGPYSWFEEQEVYTVGTVVNSAGNLLTINNFKTDKPLLYVNSPTNPTAPVSNPTGAVVSLYDAPGLPLNQGGFSFATASVFFYFYLYVSVSSGGQTVGCPPVLWSANVFALPVYLPQNASAQYGPLPLTWGGVSVTTPPTP